jgi:hypothetical protein
VRSLRRHDHDEEALAVALELEKKRPTVCSSWRGCGGCARATARVTIVERGEAMTGQLVGKLKDLGKNLHGRKNINSAKNINSGFS